MTEPAAHNLERKLTERGLETGTNAYKYMSRHLALTWSLPLIRTSTSWDCLGQGNASVLP